eukprot:TRINITY_DN3391_c0_g1_i9.p1 TRINITY_DN3391_c0_g1~~TRINITY_DN3391_c0_g1_i9.p1  ORF type:complete len:229 (+),score=23.22 TRINITY_DN3391_c0_g1_i9:64-750(+)
MSVYTFLVRHIPCKIVAADFQSAMSSLGLDSSRYQVSMPTQEQRPGVAYRPGNFGYGFVACHGEEDAQAFVNAFQSFQFENVKSHKRLLIEPSTSKRTRASRRTAVAPGSSGSVVAGRAPALASFGKENGAHHGQLFDSAHAWASFSKESRAHHGQPFDSTHARASFRNKSRAHQGQPFDAAFAKGRRLEALRGVSAAEDDVQTSNPHLHMSVPPAGSEVPPTRLCHS